MFNFQSSPSSENKLNDKNTSLSRTVSSKYLEKLYFSDSNKKTAGVRWQNNIEENEANKCSVSYRNLIVLYCKDTLMIFPNVLYYIMFYFSLEKKSFAKNLVHYWNIIKAN